ncbi:MAG: hypothetical protein IKK83_00170 [Clostridia bacterium]|nr:hypothetical protein [Clostridia bacterium]
MKRILSAFLVLLIIFQLAGTTVAFAQESDAPKHIPRVVSVVFDDSGSMGKNTDRWAYTVYAMQAFCAMMGVDDVLYITYLNSTVNGSHTVKIDLDDNSKQSSIQLITDKTVFGDGTPDKISEGAAQLVNEYKTRGKDAKYFLVVMADGELNYGSVDKRLPEVAKSTARQLNNADFQAMFFCMMDKNAIDGVKFYKATTGDEIVEQLKLVSADVMGRNNITDSCTYSGGKLSFSLPYPALSIAVFAQKENGDFGSANDEIRLSVSQGGKAADFDINSYRIDCPTKINERVNIQEVIPADPPAGFVSLIDNGSKPLPKGEYSIDLSSYDISKGDIMVLVEPAVKIGCNYYAVSSDNTLVPVEFADVNDNLREGSEIIVQCGLYEMKEDGSLGDPVSESVLSPQYGIYLNDSSIGSKYSGMDNAYLLDITKDFANGTLKIEAVLEGYQPFVLRETFGEIGEIPTPDVSVPEGSFYDTKTITKLDWQSWLNGDVSIPFSLQSASASLLDDLEIKVEGYDGLSYGICSSIPDSVTVSGNDIVYKPTFKAGAEFSDLPDSFTVSLCDTFTDTKLLTVQVSVIKPVYKIEIENSVGSKKLGLDTLKSNTEGVKFTLVADYEGDGTFVSAGNSGCEGDIAFNVEHGVLAGEVSVGNGDAVFVPRYDPAVDTGTAPSDILGKSHSISATAVVDGAEIKSDAVTLDISGVSYQIKVQNDITSAFTLDSIKTNTEKIVFAVYADYQESGSFGPLASWDTGIYDMLTISTGDLPGRFETEYDAGGVPVGKSFTPLYDEYNNGGVVFTKVAGKVHTVTAAIEQYALLCDTTVEVLAPKYDVIVRKDGIYILETDLVGNTEGVEFTVSRDGRVLTAEELEGLAPFDITLSKNKGKIGITTQVMEASDGTAYLFCRPDYVGWTFISTWLWKWTWCAWNIRTGDMNLTLTIGASQASALIDIGFNPIGFAVLIALFAAAALTCWFIACRLTSASFISGAFYTVELLFVNNKWKVTNCKKSKGTSEGEVEACLKLKARRKLSVSPNSKDVAHFVTMKGYTKSADPCWCPGEEEKKRFKKAHLESYVVNNFVNNYRTMEPLEKEFFNEAQFFDGTHESKFRTGSYLVVVDSKGDIGNKAYVVMFVASKPKNKNINI